MRIVKPEYINDATLQSTNVPESDFPVWVSTSTYSLNEELIYLDNGNHWVIRSLVNDNVANIPTGLNSDTKWVKVSETNRWKMFDLKTTSQTFNEDSIDVTVIGTGFVDSIGILSIDGYQLQIVGKDQYNNTFYDSSINLISTEGIYDPYTYFFSPLVYLSDYVVTDLPIYSLSTYQVIISKIGDIAKCGTLIIGKVIDAGGSEYGMRIGITDYSVKSADEFGDFVITERAFSRTLQVTTLVENAVVSSLANLFNSFRATPILWIGAEQISASFIYGFYKDYGVIVEYVNHSKIQFEIEGLS